MSKIKALKKSAEGRYTLGMFAASHLIVGDDAPGLEEIFSEFIGKEVKITMETIKCKK